MIILYKDKYTSFELAILIFILLNSTFSTVIINVIKNHSISEIIVSILISFILGLIYLLIIFKNYNEDLIESLKRKRITSIILITCAFIMELFFLINSSLIFKDIYNINIGFTTL